MKIEIEIPMKIIELASGILEEQNQKKAIEPEIVSHILVFLEKYVNNELFNDIVDKEYSKLNHEYHQKEQEIFERNSQQIADFREYINSLEQKYK